MQVILLSNFKVHCDKDVGLLTHSLPVLSLRQRQEESIGNIPLYFKAALAPWEQPSGIVRMEIVDTRAPQISRSVKGSGVTQDLALNAKPHQPNSNKPKSRSVGCPFFLPHTVGCAFTSRTLAQCPLYCTWFRTSKLKSATRRFLEIKNSLSRL